MKKTIIFTALISLAAVSCELSSDDIFDLTASERVQETWVNTDAILNAASNGWSMEFYYDADLSYGGLQLFLRFEDGMVEATSELETIGYTDTSTYSYAADGGASINFDTYNEVIHYFSEPSSSNTSGMGGDFEFVIMDYSDEQITLKGKRNDLTCIMTPLPDGDWSTLMTDYLALVDDMGDLKDYTFVIDGAEYDTELDANLSYTNRRLYYTDPFGDGTVEIMPFVYTLTGIKFYYPVAFGDEPFYSMTWMGGYFINDDTFSMLK